MCLAIVCLLLVNALSFLAAASTPDDEDRNSPGDVAVWIDSFSTVRPTYGIGETVNATAIVERGNDLLDMVWEGDLVLAVLDDTGESVHYDDLLVTLHVGGAQHTSYFEFSLDEAGDYLLRASLYRFNDTMVDRKEINITVTGNQQNQDPVAIIDPVSQTVEVGDVATFDGSRSNDPDGNITTYMWDFGDGTSAEGPTATYTYLATGGYNVTLLVTDEQGATATAYALVEVVDRSSLPGDVPVWISIIAAEKATFEMGEVMDVTVVVTRGPDMLTYVWEGTLVLTFLDAERVQLAQWQRPVYLPNGGDTQDMSFAVELEKSGPCILVASLYWMVGTFVDEEILNVTVVGGDENKPPTAVIDPARQAIGVADTARLDGSLSRDADGTIMSHVWDLGDGTTMEGPLATHQYQAPGIYNVTLTVTDDDGATTVAYGLVEVLGFAPPPWDPAAWIVSLTASSQVNESETVDVTATVVRGDDMLDYVWLGTLVLEVYQDGLIMTLTEQVALPTGGDEEVLHFAFQLNAPGDFLARASLKGQDGELMDVEEVFISVLGSVQDPDDGGMPELPTAAVAAAGLVVILGALAATEVGKLSLLGLFMPLYTKLKKENVLDHFTRGKIYGYILANPGDHYNSIQQAVNVPNGSFAYHISVLEKEGFIKSTRIGMNRCFFPAEMRIPSQEGTLRASQRLIVERILEEPGISQKDIAAYLGVSSSTINYHIKDLLELGVVETERKGMRLKYFINRDLIASLS
jgi:predicted transcriptional regulator/chitodextrinase